MAVMTTRTKEVEFKLYAPDAKTVSVAGQFNDWDAKSKPMKKSKDGTWKLKMKLPCGKCEYKYIVDGAWLQNMPGVETIPNPFGTNNCVMGVQ